MVEELSDGVRETQLLQKLWKKIITGEIIYDNDVRALHVQRFSKPKFFLFSLFIFSFISQLIWVRLGWNFHRWFSIQKQVNWCTSDPFSLYIFFSSIIHQKLGNSIGFCKKPKLHVWNYIITFAFKDRGSIVHQFTCFCMEHHLWKFQPKRIHISRVMNENINKENKKNSGLRKRYM